MSIKLLIVDDEPVVSQGLVTTIPWDELGVEIVGVAYNGLQGLACMEQSGADIVLTDIFMPDMDGLEMAEHIMHEYPATKIVMFSGYNEFEYARKAIRLGVEDYLLKPVDIDELMRLIQKLKRTIEKEKEDHVIRQKDQIAQMVLHYIHNAPLPPEVEPLCKNARIEFYVLVSELESYYHLADTMSGQELHALKAAWKQRICDMLSALKLNQVSVFTHENQLVTVCYDEADHLPEQTRLRERCEKDANGWDYRLRIGISGKADQLSCIPARYQEAYAALTANRGKQETVFVAGEVSAKECSFTITWSSEMESGLKEVILNRDQEPSIRLAQAERLVRQWLDQIQRSGATLRQGLQTCRELIAVLKTRVKESAAGARIDSIQLQLADEVDLHLYNTFGALEQLLLTDIMLLMDAVKDDPTPHWVIEKVKKYIHENYTRDIKAAEVAEMHYISPNYLSVLFKQATGYRFSEYVNLLRINKAKELLEKTSRKVFVIAEDVGYNEYKYFVQVFKKYVGLTPTHYRRLKSHR